jgi:hypothetical protein
LIGNKIYLYCHGFIVATGNLVGNEIFMRENLIPVYFICVFVGNRSAYFGIYDLKYHHQTPFIEPCPCI